MSQTEIHVRDIEDRGPTAINMNWMKENRFLLYYIYIYIFFFCVRKFWTYFGHISTIEWKAIVSYSSLICFANSGHILAAYLQLLIFDISTKNMVSNKVLQSIGMRFFLVALFTPYFFSSHTSFNDYYIIKITSYKMTINRYQSY